MSKAIPRRERRLIEDLRQLITSKPTQFVRVWNLYLNGWCRDASARGRALKEGAAITAKPAVFAILHKAERLLSALGDEAQRLVGRRTREFLTHECCKAVAGATDHRLYALTHDSVYQVMQASGKSLRRGAG